MTRSSYVPVMTYALDLLPVDPADLVQTLSFGLRFDTRGKGHRMGGDIMAVSLAQLLVQHLERSGYVVMRKPPAPLAKYPNVKGYLTE